ncbi:sec-independent protein translocase protein TatB [Streptomyces daqingensis]|uniref:Sec-independent protein translocase protein TatB n=1 Tax=Streptomyces daqingensis TaxID=1472640 RepID=A0ABQ2ME63_9ACTN|nr:sec-independent translocase [Streptomyces daqingensis]GGO50080.1 sec-independent protein translocase protein TatB [Streptomyces daqingensis]
MFFDIGPLELVALVILAVLIFGPDKLPKVIQDVAGFIRKVRQFSDSAKEDIRSELGPEFKDFDFEDLNPKTFARKHLLDEDDLGLKEIRNGFDFRKDMAEVTDAVNGSESGSGKSGGGSRANLTKSAGSGVATTDPLSKDRPAQRPDSDPPPFDADAT